MKLFKQTFAALAVAFLLAGTASADLAVAVGDFQPRFKPGTNGPTDTSDVRLTSGTHSISYAGTIADFRAGNADNARPFLGFDQAGAAATDYVYVDNILLTVGSTAIWMEDFSGATLGGTSGNNQNLAGTVIQTANTLSSRVVDATTDPAIALAFTPAAGNFIALSTATNSFSAIRPSSNNNPITFASVPDTTPYRMTFDIFIPAAVPEPSTLALFGMTAFGAAVRRRRKS